MAGKKNPIDGIDPVIHERVRLGIMSCLAGTEEMSFNEIKDILNLTDGNLSAHALVLENAGFIKIEKSFEGKKPKTTVKISPKGKTAFGKYLQLLERMLKRGKEI